MDEKAKRARREYQRKYRQANRDQINKKRREWNAKNADKVSKWRKAWNEANPDKVRAIEERYWQKKAQEMAPTCLHCGKEFHSKRVDAKFCSTSCRVIHNRKQKRKKP